MKGISTNVIRLNKRYKLKNYGEVTEFEVMEFLNEGNFRLKDIHTLEEYQLDELTAFGKGKDFEIREI
ncbi:MAG TPA: hypothetical protein PKL31_10495 [Fulvivirga sp.]|nr:hypothetical protein [Fulvivirga sp.]